MSSFNSFYIIKCRNAAGETCLATTMHDGWSALPMVLMDTDDRKHERMGRKTQVCEFAFTDEENRPFKVFVFDLGCDLTNVTLPDNATLAPTTQALTEGWLSTTSSNVVRAFRIHLNEDLVFPNPIAWLTGKAGPPGIAAPCHFDARCTCAGHGDSRSWWYLPCGHEMHLVCLNRARTYQVHSGVTPRCPVCGKTDPY